MFSSEQSVCLEEECQVHLTTTTAERCVGQNAPERCPMQQSYHFLAPVSANTYTSSRLVPDVSTALTTSGPGEGLEVSRDVTGTRALSVPQSCGPPQNSEAYHHQYMDLPEQRELLVDRNRGGYHPLDTTPGQLTCYQDSPSNIAGEHATRNLLYDFEDGLRHKVNVYLEDFRLGLQQAVAEGFREFRSPAQRGEKWGGCDPVPLPTCHQGGGGGGGGVADSDTLSSGAHSVVDCSVSTEQLIDQELIQLQTLSALITSTLRRAEYHQDSAEM